MDEWMDGWMNEWYGITECLMDRPIDGWTDARW